MAQRYGFGLGVLEQLLAHRIFQIVADIRDRKIIPRGPVRAALKPHDLEAGFGQFSRENAAGESNADADRIDLLEHRGHGRLPSRKLCPQEKSAMECGGLSYFLL